MQEKKNEANDYLLLKLTKNESLVLFEFLGRINEDAPEGLFEDQAEERVLWDIECLLEKQLTEPFQMNYQALIQQAREDVRDDLA